jgi:hypothetical protein
MQLRIAGDRWTDAGVEDKSSMEAVLRERVAGIE